MIYEFKLPDIGEGLVEGEVTKWHVKEGDVVKENQPLANVLTDKAEIEIPSPKDGKVLKLMAKEGEKIKVHAVLIMIDIGGGAAATPPHAPAATAPQVQPSAAKASAAVPAKVSATPLVRKLASQLNVDLGSLKGSGPGGRVTEQDIRSAVGGAQQPKAAAQPALQAPGAVSGLDDRVPFIGIRRRTAEKMAQSARTVAAVTHVDECDFTALAALREELKGEAAKKGLKLTFLPFIIKAVTRSLKEFPDFNASLDEQGGFILRKAAHNIGMAVSAEQGLVVPNIKNADAKDLWVLAEAVGRLAEKVRSGKIAVNELQGGTFTITNIGPIGGLFTTPLVNHPEVAILGVMKLQKRPVVRDGGIHIRDMAYLALSFDHRVVDGAEAAHFMNTIIKHLENPRTLL